MMIIMNDILIIEQRLHNNLMGVENERVFEKIARFTFDGFIMERFTPYLPCIEIEAVFKL